MAKAKVRFVCSSCGSVTVKYQGKCFECNEWGTLVEERMSEPTSSSKSEVVLSARKGFPKRLSEIDDAEGERYKTGIEELDRTLGGGLMSGSGVLIGGEPGIGKSTLMLQIIPHLASKGILYVSAEESLYQIKSRAIRMGVMTEKLQLLAETELECIIETAMTIKPKILIVDSIQTIYSGLLDSSPGGVSQVRECTSQLMRFAKEQNIAVFIIGHITKEGVIAGPKILEHIVDTVLLFEGDMHHRYRMIRALKNRYGSTNEIGIFEMVENGLKEISNPSELFLSERSFGVSGVSVAASMEGTRPILVEVQALVAKTNYSVPQRVSAGLDYKRLTILLATLEKRLGYALWTSDVFFNVSGGMKLTEPAIDLAVISAVASSFKDIPINPTTVAIGEVGLAGELRAVVQVERRIYEAEKLGFENVVIPKRNFAIGMDKKFKIKISPVPTLSKALDLLFS